MNNLTREHYGLAIDVTDDQEHEHSCLSEIESLLEQKVESGEVTSFALVYVQDETITQEISNQALQWPVDDK